jgi:hypothetical protein
MIMACKNYGEKMIIDPYSDTASATLELEHEDTF